VLLVAPRQCTVPSYRQFCGILPWPSAMFDSKGCMYYCSRTYCILHRLQCLSFHLLVVSVCCRQNSSGDEIANVKFLYDDIVHALQNTIDWCINSATDRPGYVLERRFTKFSGGNGCDVVREWE